MADAAAGVMKGLPLFRDKLPRVLPRRQREFQHAECVPVTRFAVRSGEAEKIVAAAASSYDNLPDPIYGIGFALGVLRRESFVGVFVSGKDQVGVRGVQVFP